MGCPTSKLDSEDAVFSCKERRLPVKQAEQHRHCAELELYIEASLILISQETFIEWQETRELFISEGKHQWTRVEQQDKGDDERTSTVPVIQAMTGSILDMPFLIFSFVLVHTYMYISFLYWMHVASPTAPCVGRNFEYE
ncbi:uncharacterized protein LOC131857583 [Cryptomeria japonica]|uniref:uncharacterized protein LOC131857583 n=1 Tax=Cryptomeria japonica TaxID=3369 RepID=UPI0027DA8A9C|nr:uncharacterized protein LOC131857583 [Cryptomeria japonica]